MTYTLWLYSLSTQTYKTNSLYTNRMIRLITDELTNKQFGHAMSASN